MPARCYFLNMKTIKTAHSSDRRTCCTWQSDGQTHQVVIRRTAGNGTMMTHVATFTTHTDAAEYFGNKAMRLRDQR